ncbi:NRDE family protein [Colwellia sp. C1TZA3]|uniref:NRDE family protein n=1 Tax=Colwellia sp. C1TZA3 TaxID=2508879 RepID=UPI0011B9AA55|nr:NRDE family protein [Colwellia sp. C1TZA3]TWX68464.1 NRDE family protein [Colwellia sp. C1TZA3]
MCILFIAVEQHPDYPVIICANRDEFHQRPTQNMHWWPEQKMLAGKDLQAQGTWLGLNPEGYFSALTNFRRPTSFDAKKHSRGDLVVRALKDGDLKTQQHLSQVSDQYNDFNLVFGPLDNLQAFDSVNKNFINLKAGFHSVCNGALDDIWPKMTLGINTLESLIMANKVNIEEFFAVMMNRELAQEQHLPATGISEELESLLSSIFIVSPDYGTRSTAIILQSKIGSIEVYERDYNRAGEVLNQNKFNIEPSKKS